MNRISGAWRTAILVLLTTILGACATPAPILTESVGTIRTGIGAARDQSQTAFEGANRIARDQAIERKVADKAAKSLAEDDFPLAVDPISAGQWAAAFNALDGYTASLQTLLDPKLAQGTGDAIQSLGEQLQNGKAINVKLPSGIAGVFATFGQALIQAHAEKSATEVMRRVTPDFTGIMSGMADAIGADNNSDLRGTVRANWQTALSNILVTYAKIPADDREARRATIRQFLDAMDARDTQLANLDALRTSLIALGEAHAAAGRGSHAEALFWIERIDGWLEDIKARTEAIQKQHDELMKALEEKQK